MFRTLSSVIVLSSVCPQVCSAYESDQYCPQVHTLENNFPRSPEGSLLLQHGTLKAVRTRTPVWVWWDIAGTRVDALQQACVESWKVHAPSETFDIHFVNSSNARGWLPEIPDHFFSLLHSGRDAVSDADVEPRGTDDKDARRSSDSMRRLAIKIVQAGLLARYGGVFMDRDTLLHDDLATILARVAGSGTAIIGESREECRDGAVWPSFMVGRKGNGLSEQWYAEALKQLGRPLPQSIDEKPFAAILAKSVGSTQIGDSASVVCIDRLTRSNHTPCMWDCLSEPIFGVGGGGIGQLIMAPAVHLRAGEAPPVVRVAKSVTEIMNGGWILSDILRRSLFPQEGSPILSQEPSVLISRGEHDSLDRHHKKTHKRRLAFIHIPRTAGTTLETLSNREARDRDKWGTLNPGLNGLRAVSTRARCYGQHVPPSLIPEFYAGRETFCVVRHPFDRAVSEFGYNQRIRGNPDCNAAALNRELSAWLQNYTANPYLHDCHLLPQAAYVVGWDPDTETVDTEGVNPACMHVLHFERLQAEFDALMSEFGYPYEFPRSKALPSSHECAVLSRTDLLPEVRAKLVKAFALDFVLFNYSADVPRL